MFTKTNKIAVLAFVLLLFFTSLCSASNITVYKNQSEDPSAEKVSSTEPAPAAVDPKVPLIKKEIKDRFGITIYDNDGLTIDQLEKIKGILGVIPSGLYDLKVITVNEFLNGVVPEPQELARMNILSNKLKAWKEDCIPDDKKQLADSFAIGFMHELNHRVSNKYRYKDTNPRIRLREEELMGQAANDHLQYLRSDSPDNFFIIHPEEFFALLANACLQDTQAGLDLGIASYDNRLKEPINQVLFFIELYSPSGNKIRIYKVSPDGKLFKADVPVVRDANGYIINISDLGGATYKFIRDKKGNVTAAYKSCVIVTDVSLDPTVVTENGSYVCTIKGTFPSDTYFGAVFTTNNGPEQRCYIWQQGASMTHQLNSTVPAGTYTIKKLFIVENGKDKIVWKGNRSVTVTKPAVTDVSLDPTVVTENGSYVCNIKGTYPPDTYYGAVFTTNDGPEQRCYIWQQGASMRHQLDTTVPAGTYKIKKLFIVENGKDKIVWTGDRLLIVR